MSTDEKKLELLNSTLTTSTIDTELKEIKFDDWDNSELMDLFNGWPEDGDPVTVTVNKNYDDE